MSDKSEKMFLDFVTVYLRDRETMGLTNAYVEDEVERLTLESEVNSTELLDSKEYDE